MSNFENSFETEALRFADSAWDDKFAETYSLSAEQSGMIAYSIRFDESFCPYGRNGYAMAFVLTADEYAAAMQQAEARARKAIIEAEANQYRMPGEASIRFEPLKFLPWDDMISLPTFIGGRSRQEALLKASELHLRHELAKKAACLLI